MIGAGDTRMCWSIRSWSSMGRHWRGKVVGALNSRMDVLILRLPRATNGSVETEVSG